MSEPIPIPAHLGGSYAEGDSNTICHDVFGYLIVKFGLKSMIDIGCGHGHAMEWFSRFLVHAIGFDGDPNAINNHKLPGHAFLHDFTLGEPSSEVLHPDARYDLAWSAEFLEHVEEKYMANYMAVFRRCKYAVVTHAMPDQVGHHHVNCQTSEYWIQKFAEAGFIYSPSETAFLRATDRWNAGWGRKTLMFFERL